MYRFSLKGLVKLIAVLLITIATKTHAQTTESGFQTPNFAPKTPEAASFLKYGEYPVDLSTGVPNISIPLYTIDLGNYKMPITLNYHASGIKVDQESTWVGLGWNLNYGAQVILSVRDDIDENNPYIDDVPDSNAIIADWNIHRWSFNSGMTLSEHVDKPRVKDFYSFSSPTANGSFYIKDFETNDVVVVPPDSSFKVKLLGESRQNMGFIITDSYGNVYTFNNTKEISAGALTHSDYYISAWYVDNIKTATNKEINFIYQNDGTIYDQSFYHRVDVKTTGVNQCRPDSGLESHTVKPVIEVGSATMTQAKKIKEIIFNDGASKVVFTKTNGRQDLLNGNGYLSKIEIKQLLDNEFKNVKGLTFEYTYFNNSSNSYLDKRLKLNRIVNLLGQNEEEFVYSNISLPPKNSFSRDYYGYYNGYSNINMVPVHFLSAPFSQTAGNANRNINTGLNQAGMLTEIHYPTGGSSKFNYETNQYVGIDELNKYNLKIVSSNLLSGITDGSRDPNGFIPNEDEQTPNPGEWKLCNSESPDCVYYRDVPFQAIQASGTLSFDVISDIEDEIKMKYRYSRVRVFINGVEKYDSNKVKNTMSFSYNFSGWDSGVIVMEAYSRYAHIANLQMRYTYTDTTPKNIYTGGLRIKNIENYDNGNTMVLKKEYDYSDITDTTKSSGKLINNLSTSFITKPFDDVTLVSNAGSGLLCGAGVNYTTTYSINSNSSYGIEGNAVAYQYVREKLINTSNASLNGYTLFKFSTDPDEIPFGDPSVQVYKTWKRGKILEKSVYKTNANNSYLIRKETNNYLEDNSNIARVYGFKSWKHCSFGFTSQATELSQLSCPYIGVKGQCYVPDDVFSMYEIMTYNLPFPWFYLKSTITEDYFYDAYNFQTGKVTTTNTYNYSNPSHLQLTSQTTTNSTGETLHTRYLYAGDSEMSGRPFVNDLKEAHMIGIPLDTQTFNAANKLSEQLTIYDKSSANNNLLLPKSVYINKGDAVIDLNTDKKITYDQYDDRGNVLQYTPESGIPVSVIWGYNKTQPIARIDNITYNSIPAATIANLQTLSNADSDNCLSVDCTEQLLRNALNIFRNSLPDTFVSAYTYNPLVGVTSLTDPKGVTTYYEYDTNNRLRFVKDKDLNVLQKYCYNYMGQNVDCSDNSSTTIVMYRSIARSGSFTKNNCASGGVPSDVSYSQPVGAATSIVSQADADAKGLAKFNTDGQVNANMNGTCAFSSIARNGNFTKNNCPEGGAGSSVAFSQAAGAVTSIISQTDADSQGLVLFNTNGQANANTHGTCTFSSIAKSGSFKKNNCAAGGVGATVIYIVPAGKYNSTTSQAAADELAQNDVNNNGQAYANTNGSCTFSSITKTGSFTKNNCVAGAFGSIVLYTVPAGTYSSTISQAAADEFAQTDVDNNGQSNANTTGNCIFYNAAISKTFTRNNCPSNAYPGSYVYTIAYGKYSSTISQAKADQLAQNQMESYGQNWTNEEATCTFYSAARSGTFTRNNCGTGYTGSSVTYILNSGALDSTVSQADADNKAESVFYTYGQVYANTHGTCTAIPQPVNFLYETFFNASTRVFTIDAWATGTNHNGATMNFTINYIRTSGSAATKAVSVIFAAGEADKLTTTSLLASSITSVTVQVIKN